ncbi:MAG TPA: hypothetical protein VGB91_08700 [Rhizomicrobium sp.]
MPAFWAKLGRVVAANIDINGVAVDQVLVEVPVIAVEAQSERIACLICAAKLRQLHLVVHRLREGEYRARVGGQHLHRCRADGRDRIGRAGKRQMQGQPAGLIGDVPIGLFERGGRAITEAIILQTADAEIDAEVAETPAVFRMAANVAERAAGNLGVGPVERQGVLHLQRHRATHRVQPEHRIVALKREAIDGEFRDQVPIHIIAEGFVEARAVLIDRDAFGYARDRRSLEAAIDEVGLELTALLVVERDAGELGGNGIGQDVLRGRESGRVRTGSRPIQPPCPRRCRCPAEAPRR